MQTLDGFYYASLTKYLISYDIFSPSNTKVLLVSSVLLEGPSDGSEIFGEGSVVWEVVHVISVIRHQDKTVRRDVTKRMSHRKRRRLPSTVRRTGKNDGCRGPPCFLRDSDIYVVVVNYCLLMSVSPVSPKRDFLFFRKTDHINKVLE